MQNLPRYALTIAALLAAAAALAEAVPEALRRCAAIEDNAARLACYDAYVAGARAAGAADSAAPGEPPASGVTPDRAEQAEARFGLPVAAEDQPQEITAKLTDIVERANGERIFTLDNGQVWVEDSRARTLKLDVGDTVRISAGAFGSFRLRGSSNRSTSVDRVR